MKYKRILILIITLIFCFVGSVSINAEEIETKTYCAATVEDDFSLNSILVVLNNKKTFAFDEYYPAHFSSVCCTEVINLTKNTQGIIKQTLNAEKNGDYSKLNHLIENSMLPDVNSFRTILKLSISEIPAETEEEIIKAKERILYFVDELSKMDEFSYVGVDYIYDTCSTSEETTIDYSANKSEYDLIELSKAWTYSTGSNSVMVGVVDSGVYGNHPYLQSNLNTTLSKSFSDKYNNPFIDENGHGTKVAGIIGASYNEEKKMVGVCQNVSLISLKVCDDVNGEIKPVSSNVVEAINYATEKNIPILNISISFVENDVDATLQTAINNYPGLIVCAAGNNVGDIDNNPRFPANYTNDNIIVVGASSVGVKDAIYSLSNYGKKSVDLFAPADSTYTTFNNGEYGVFFASSAAAPIVTGVAVLIKTYRPYLTASEIKSAILSTVDKSDFLTNFCVTGGRVNAYKAISQCDMYHSHSYSAKFTYRNVRVHIVNCPCGYIGELPHAVLAGTKTCIDCKGLVENGFIGIMSNNIKYKTNNGSYKLPNGVVVLTSEDLESYLKGNLEFNIYGSTESNTI